MKKLKLILIALAIYIIPINIFASTQTTDLIDTLIMEGIEPEFKEYKEKEGQVTIYFFRSSSCGHCHHFLEFLNSISKKYADKIKLRAYEVSTNMDNQLLKDNVVNFFQEDAPGVPYIVIGENTFYGYSDNDNSKIIKSIENEYKSKIKYDVIDEMKKKKDNKNPNDVLYILLPILFIVIGFKFLKK